MQWLPELLDFAEKAKRYNGWFDECDTLYYYFAMQDELQEVKREVLDQDRDKLEDELGDVLWTFLNFINKLDATGRIDRDAICTNALRKFSERMPYIVEERRENDRHIRTRLWNEAKTRQKKG